MFASENSLSGKLGSLQPALKIKAFVPEEDQVGKASLKV